MLMISTTTTSLGMLGFDLKKLLDIIWDENNYNFVSKKKTG